MEYFFEHHDKLWYFIAGVSFVIELSIMGLSGPLLFFAIGSVLTAILVSLGFIDGWQAEVLTVGILTALTALILWNPLKKLQNSKTDTDNSSDMIGLRVPASSDITLESGSIRYSGIDWQARLAKDNLIECITNSTMCEIVAISGNTMLVKPMP